jgi:hypothetical protein
MQPRETLRFKFRRARCRIVMQDIGLLQIAIMRQARNRAVFQMDGWEKDHGFRCSLFSRAFTAYKAKLQPLFMIKV